MSPFRIPDPTETCLTVLLSAAAIFPIGSAEVVVYNQNVRTKLIRSDWAEADAGLFADKKVKKWAKFQALVRQWHVERGAMSSITEMSALPSYQKIIGMGEDAIPLILAQLRSEGDEPDQWFWALRSLTDANPVRDEDQGDFVAMAQAWLRWSESEEYAG